MTVTDTQKVDLLYKKLAWGVAKTDTNPPKDAPNESVASPLLIRGDLIWQQSGSIPTSIPSTSSSIVQVYKDNASGNSWTQTVQTTVDNTSTTNRTWLTNITDWIPVEFGSTYFVKIYSDTTGSTTAQSTGTQLGAGGASGSSADEWFFDYQAGVLNFIGNNLPSSVTTGKSIFVSGARYIGTKGFSQGSSYSNSNVASYLPTYSGNIGAYNVNANIYTSNIGASSANANIFITPGANGYVSVNTNTAFQVPVGTNTSYPPVNRVGMLRWNSDLGYLEVYTGINWEAVGIEGGTTAVISDVFNTGDGNNTQFILSQNNTTSGALVSVNGVLQLPTTSYIISGNVITFNEAPLSTDIIEVRQYVPSTTVGQILNGNAEIQTVYINGIATSQFINDGLTTLTVDSANVNVLNTLQVSKPIVANVSNTAVNSSTVLINSFLPTLYRTAKYIINASNYGSNYFQSSEALVVHNGSTANISVYANTTVGTSIFTLSANIYNSNVSLWATTTTNGNNIKVSATYIPL